MPGFFCIIAGPDLRYEYVNTAHQMISGGQDLTGQTLREAHPGLLDSNHIMILEGVLNTGEASIVRESTAVIRGEVRYFDLIYAPRRNMKGHIDGILALGTDVTDRVRSRHMFERSEAQIRLITDKLPAFVSYVDPEGHYQFLNARYSTWFRKPISEMVGKKWVEFLGHDVPELAKEYEKQTQQGQAIHYEKTLHKSNGEYRHLDLDFLPDLDPVTQRFRGMVIVGVDVTDRKDSLRVAEVARQDLDRIFMQVPLPMCMLTGPNYVFTLANSPYLKLVEREVLGKAVLEIFSDEEVGGFISILDQVYKGGEPFVMKEAFVQLTTREGGKAEYVIDTGFYPHRDLQGNIKGILNITQDVTEQVTARKRVEKLASELQEAVAARDTFLGIASHELKTPLTSLKLQSEMNLKIFDRDGVTAFTHDKLKKLLVNSIKQIERLSRLVNDMLDISRISAGKLAMNFSNGDLSEVVTATVEHFSAQFAATGSKIDLDLEPGIVIPLDMDRMEQVLTNLMTNAMKYAPEKPIHVWLRRVNHQAILRVVDQGPGVLAKHQERIFERFERATSASEVSGLGLGLHISKQIVEAHRGTIRVESQEGEGAAFIIELPAY
jgi:PAS domain S-box-containing protein